MAEQQDLKKAAKDLALVSPRRPAAFGAGGAEILLTFQRL